MVADGTLLERFPGLSGGRRADSCGAGLWLPSKSRDRTRVCRKSEQGDVLEERLVCLPPGDGSDENKTPSRTRPGHGGPPGAGAACVGSPHTQSAHGGASRPGRLASPGAGTNGPLAGRAGGFDHLQGAVWTVTDEVASVSFSGNLAGVEGDKKIWGRGTGLPAGSL